MPFILGTKSLAELSGVNADLVRVVKRALQLTPIDFIVNDGIRTVAEQRKYVAQGTSHTMKSKHLEGRAVDLVGIDAKGRMLWEWGSAKTPGPVVMIAHAVIKAAKELGLSDRITWGAVWDRRISQLRSDLPKDLYAEIDAYKARHPGSDFLDGPHFEIK